MYYFGIKSQKMAKRWGLRPQIPLPLAAGELRSQTLVQFK